MFGTPPLLVITWEWATKGVCVCVCVCVCSSARWLTLWRLDPPPPPPPMHTHTHTHTHTTTTAKTSTPPYCVTHTRFASETYQTLESQGHRLVKSKGPVCGYFMTPPGP